MISREEAQALVERRLAQRAPLPDGDTMVVVPEHTQEHEFGWVFFYNSRSFIETGDFSSSLVGNGPFMVDRRTGALEVLPTYGSVEQHLAAREARPRRIVISGWQPGFRKMSLTRLLRDRLGLSLPQAHALTCRVTEGEVVTLDAVDDAKNLVRELAELGATARIDE